MAENYDERPWLFYFLKPSAPSQMSLIELVKDWVKLAIVTRLDALPNLKTSGLQI